MKKFFRKVFRINAKKVLSFYLFSSLLYFVHENRGFDNSRTQIEGLIFPIFLPASFPPTKNETGRVLNITKSQQENISKIASIPIEIKHIFEKKNCKSSFIDVNNNETTIESINESLNSLITNVGRIDVHYNMYTTYLGFAYSNTTAYNNVKNCHLIYEKEGPVVGHYDMLICHSHYFLYYYGHVFMDYLAPLILYPRYIRERAHIVVTMKMDVYPDALDILGFTPDRRVFLGQHQFAHANILYTFQPGACLDFIGEAFHQVRNIIHKHYHLEKIVPTRYVLYNRENRMRVIKNFNKLVYWANKLHPEIKWEIRPLITKLDESAAYYASVKLFFSVCCSALSNNLLMHKGSSVCEILLGGSPFCHCVTCRIAGLIHTIITLPSFADGSTEFTLPKELFIKAIDVALKRQKEYSRRLL